MNRRQIIIIFIIILIALIGIKVLGEKIDKIKDVSVGQKGETKIDMNFLNFDLETNTSKTNIDLNLVLSGGPGKDGIPAINNPKFVSLDEVDINEDERGILLNSDNEQRFYPYAILVWHEIVNDRFDGEDVAITFCPLCDSAVVYNRKVNDEILTFGVSGLLFESNLLMYDLKTESLWSQARGEGVVGEYTGTILDLVSFQLITFKELKEKYPKAKVLSKDTGFNRSYGRYPYGDYLTNDTLFFPVSVSDQRFPTKELFYVFPFNEKSYAIQYSKIIQGENNVGKFTINRDGGEIFVYSKGELIPGYFELWFSWAVHHQESGIILEIE